MSRIENLTKLKKEGFTIFGISEKEWERNKNVIKELTGLVWEKGREVETDPDLIPIDFPIAIIDDGEGIYICEYNEIMDDDWQLARFTNFYGIQSFLDYLDENPFRGIPLKLRSGFAVKLEKCNTQEEYAKRARKLANLGIKFKNGVPTDFDICKEYFGLDPKNKGLTFGELECFPKNSIVFNNLEAFEKEVLESLGIDTTTPYDLGYQRPSVSFNPSDGFIISTNDLSHDEWDEISPIIEKLTGLKWKSGDALTENYPLKNWYLGYNPKKWSGISWGDLETYPKSLVYFDSIDEFLTIVSKEE